MFGAGGVLAAVVGLYQEEPVLSGVLRVVAVVAVLLAAVVARVGRVGRCAAHTVLALSSLIVVTAAMAASDPSQRVAFASCYSVVFVATIATTSWAGAVPHLLLGLGALGWLFWDSGPADPTAYLVVTYIVVMVGVFSGRILRAAAAAEVDGLTGLSNRRGAERALEAVLDTFTGSQPYAVAILDLDHLREVNDHEGVAQGDELLRETARRLQRQVVAWGHARPLLARWGGDEFIVGAPVEVAVLAAAIDTARSDMPARHRWSAGVARAVSGDTVSALVRRVDDTVYAAKHAGPGQTLIAASPSPQGQADLAPLLATALDTGQVTAVYQPLVDPADGTITGVETLARWQHPDLGQVPPDRFIPVAETSGLIHALGQLMLEVACRDIAAVNRDLGTELLVTVNASGRELAQPSYVCTVRRALHHSGLPARRLVIEVTESSLDAASASTRNTLDELRTLGVGVAIDDFGTGYSAFSQLDTIPADYLKLDSAFTAQIITSPRRRAMLSTLVDLSEALDLKIIAEGVETAEQARQLADQGCALAQGYHFARPQPIGALRTRLHTDRTRTQGSTAAGPTSILRPHPSSAGEASSLAAAV